MGEPASSGPRSGAKREAKARITERDRVLLSFMAEHRLVLASHVQALLEISASAANSRLRLLREAGYLNRDHKLHGEPASYQIARDGLRAIGTALPRPRAIDLSCYRHDVGLAWLWLAARAGSFGPLREIVSERRMRSHDGVAGDRAEPLGVRLGGVGPDGRTRLHYPDLILGTASGHRVAIELELSSKSRARREGILAGYGAEARIDAVLYLVDRPAVGRALQRSAARLGMTSRVRVQPVRLAQIGERGPGGLTTERRPDRDRERTSREVEHPGRGARRTLDGGR